MRLRCIPIQAIATVGKNCGPQFAECVRDAHVLVILRVLRDDYFIHKRKCADYFRALARWHERESFLRAQPVVVIQYDNEPIAERARLFEHPHVADVQWIEAPRDRHPADFFLLFLFHVILLRAIKRSCSGVPLDMSFAAIFPITSSYLLGGRPKCGRITRMFFFVNRSPFFMSSTAKSE